MTAVAPDHPSGSNGSFRNGHLHERAPGADPDQVTLLLHVERHLSISDLVGVPVDERAMDLGRTATASATARYWLEAELRDLGLAEQMSGARLELAQLMISELVANVFLHTRSTARASVGAHDARLHVAVSDDDATVPAPAQELGLGTSGRGLRIVSDLADAWGVEPLSPGGKAVWFSLAI
jgi:anti-sigma regulatory factor (Ser/Thr protein kinase)